MRIVFIGTGEIGLPTLRALLQSKHQVVGVVTQPDKPAGRSQSLEQPPIKKALAGTTMSILQPARIKEPVAIEEIRALEPDIIVVIAYGQILPRAVLDIPKIACLNLHASLLPRWRGAAPIQAAIAAGDPETGMTVMYMDEGLDTGDILLQRRIDILPNETGGLLHDRLAEIAPEALIESLRLLEEGKAPRVPQNSELATVAPKLKREHGKIDWNETAQNIERKIRAFNPWPGAFTQIRTKTGKSQNLKIFSASVIPFKGEAGAVHEMDHQVVVTTADGALALHEVQLEGKQRMPATEFVRGHPFSTA